MHHQYRILLVEDTPELREDISLELQDAGYHVFEADNGQAALTAFAKDIPDLVICDILLPDMDGLSVIAAIRATTSSSSNTPVIVVSAFCDPDLHRGARLLGVKNFLVKPVNYADLLQLIEHSLLPVPRQIFPDSCY